MKEFTSAIRAKKTKVYYTKHLRTFLDCAACTGNTLEEKARDFADG